MQGPCISKNIILDCTEIYIERVRSKVVYSETSGEITFLSSLYEGSISDKEISKQSGVLSLLEEG